MKRAFLKLSPLLLGLFSMSALAQRPVDPPPRPEDAGPSLAVTMQFIQDKLNEQGTLGYVVTQSSTPFSKFRTLYTISSVAVGSDLCSIDVTEKVDVTIDSLAGWDFKENGNVVKGDNLHRVTLETSQVSVRNIGQITVENMVSTVNNAFVESAHPEITATITPDVFNLILTGGKPIAVGRLIRTIGSQPASTTAINMNTDVFHMRSEEMANRLAKAFVHATELCGGGNKDPF